MKRFASDDEAFVYSSESRDDAQRNTIQKRIGIDWYTWVQKGWEEGRWELRHDETDAVEIMLRAQDARIAAGKK